MIQHRVPRQQRTWKLTVIVTCFSYPTRSGCRERERSVRLKTRRRLARESGCRDLHRSDHLRHACLAYFKLSCHGLEALEISYYGRVKLMTPQIEGQGCIIGRRDGRSQVNKQASGHRQIPSCYVDICPQKLFLNPVCPLSNRGHYFRCSHHSSNSSVFPHNHIAVCLLTPILMNPSLWLTTHSQPFGPGLSNSETEALNGSTLQSCVLERDGDAALKSTLSQL